MSGATPFTVPALISQLRGLYDGELPHLCDIVAPVTEEGATPTRVRDSGGGWLPAPAPDEESEAPTPEVTSDVPCLFIVKTDARALVGDAVREDYDAVLELSATVEVSAKHTFVIDGKGYTVAALDNHRPNSFRQRIKVKSSVS